MTYNSIAEFIVALNNAKNNIVQGSKYGINPSINKMMDAVSKRVGQTGKDSDGGSFSVYSESYKKRKTRYGKTPYGKTINFKNFNYTGSFMNDITVIDIEETPTSVHKSVGFVGSTSNGRNILTHQNLYQKLSGDENKEIIKPNTKEELILVAGIERSIYNYLIKVL